MLNPLKIVCTLILCTLFLDGLAARSKAVGSTFSYAGPGLVYEHGIDEKTFAEIQLRMETIPLYDFNRRIPGISASFTWNMIFAGFMSRHGNKVELFAGPGAFAGWSDDVLSRKGLIFGLKGRVGGECRFKRNVSVSISVSPVLGVHLGRSGSMMTMLLYQSGLLYGIMPEVGIKYAF